MNWHTLPLNSLLENLDSRVNGLTSAEAEERLQQHGPNELAEAKKKPAWVMFLLQFKDVMILILMAAALVSGIIGDLKDTIIILVIVIINAVVGFVQEYRAEKAMDALKKMAASFAKVKRSEQIVQIPSSALVPGDIVLLEAGDIVPADLRLVESHALKVEEASLTGESQPVEKIPSELAEDTSLADRTNMLYKSTLVTYGRGAGITVATGMNTEVGSIAKMLQEEESVTPLQKRLADFGKKLSIAVLIICIILYIVGLLRGEDPLRMLLTSISVAVAAIPEALPAVVTIALALGAKRMVQQNALIRKLPAVETLGSVTYVCSDKTGTLTQNKMTVKEVWWKEDVRVEGMHLNAKELFLFSMAVNQDTRTNENGERKGDPTEIALVDYALQQKEFNNEWLQKERVYELPFDSDRKLMTTVQQLEKGKYVVITKGALESILGITQSSGHALVTEESDKLAKKGQRVLVFAYKLINEAPDVRPGELEKDQQVCGLAGIIDPPRPEAKAAVDECKNAGIVPVMITGDHPLTAQVIAKELGIIAKETDRAVTGKELEALPAEEFEKEIENIKVYARVSPEQKLQIVKTLQSKNQFVAMTGDGVNDAPALKRANIGVAMGITGTDVSKEAAHMILLDDNFATIIKSVREGRRIFDNIRKFIKYAMTGNSGEIWAIFLAPLVGLPIPLLPIHILWINLVTDGLPGLALAQEPAERNIMQRKPRNPGESIFAQGMGWHILFIGLLIGLVCLATQAWAMNEGNSKWQTMVFTILCFSQLVHVLAIRSEHESLFKQGILSNKLLLAAVFFTFLLQLALIYIPTLQELFSLQALTLKELVICILLSLITFTAVEIEKWIRRRKAKRK